MQTLAQTITLLAAHSRATVELGIVASAGRQRNLQQLWQLSTTTFTAQWQPFLKPNKPL